MDISRREALNRLTAIVGGAISAPTLSAVMSGCRAQPAAEPWTPQVLTTDQVELVGTLVDIIIPATDTPGAREAGVPFFIDKLLADWIDAEERAHFMNGLAGIDQEMQQANSVAFREATPEQQTALLVRLDQEALQAMASGVRPRPFFSILKEWTMVGYYTSEIGATEELQWLAAPGRYDGDMPLEEVGRTWA